RRSAISQAIDHLNASVDRLKTLPETPERALHEVAIQTALGRAYAVIKGWDAPEAEEAYRRALEVARQVEDPSISLPAAGGLLSVFMVSGREKEAVKLGEALTERARQSDDL